jgi:release factor glutamine methyltransferase
LALKILECFVEEGSKSKSIWTPLKIIQWAVPYLNQKGIENAKFDTEVLIAHALNIDRLKVYLQFDRPLDEFELKIIHGFLKRRSQHEPIQYITGIREFFGHSFKVAPGVLIPRPETEHLVTAAIDYLKDVPEEERLVLDLGTGSGCIALSVAKAIPCRVWAVDISEIALRIAKENASNLGVLEGIHWRQGDWFAALTSEDPSQFKVILSNPPYVPIPEKDSLSVEVKDFEPIEALFGGEDGLAAYKKVVNPLVRHLGPGGMALLELHDDGCDKVKALYKDSGLKETVVKDLRGFSRVLRLIN